MVIDIRGYARQNLRTILFAFAILAISAGVLIVDAFRDDDFCRFDSPFYSSIAQNVIISGQWAPILKPDNKPFNEHPPLSFWVTALSLKFFGESAFTAVLPCAIFTMAACLAVFLIGTFVRNEYVGFFAGLALLFTRYIPRVGRHNVIEIPLMFFVTLSVLFLLAGTRRRFWYIIFGASAACAVLTKMAPGFMVWPIAIIFLCAERRFKDIFSFQFIAGVLLFLGLVGAWFFVEGGMSAAGARTVFNIYTSFTSGAFHGLGHVAPESRLRFITRLFEFCWLIVPGVILGIYFIIRRRSEYRASHAVIIWPLVFIGAYLVSSWRIGLYLLPIYPALAVICGIGIDAVLKANFRPIAVAGLIAFFLGNIAAPFLFPHWEPKSAKEVVCVNTYFPNAQKTLLELNNSLGAARFVSFRQNEAETIFFFRRYHSKIEHLSDLSALENIASGQDPAIVYISGEEYANLPISLQNKLKIAYVFGRNLFCSNRNAAAFTYKKTGGK